jgi:hypothetical protein
VGTYGEETGASNNGYAVQAVNNSATGWGVYSSGTSPNYFNGKVGIGTTSPAAKLDVVGAVKLSDTAQNCSHATDTGAIRYNSASFKLQSCKNGTGWTDVGGTVSPAGSDKQVQWNNNGTLAASSKLTFSSTSGLLTVTGDIHYSGLLTDTSDRRAKSDIKPLPGQLQKLMRLQPVSFVMNNDPQHRTELGLIAQDAEPLYPDLVQTDPDGMKSISYVSLAAPLIKAVQEEQAEINQLRAMLAIAVSGGVFLLWRNRAKVKM